MELNKHYQHYKMLQAYKNKIAAMAKKYRSNELIHDVNKTIDFMNAVGAKCNMGIGVEGYYGPFLEN